jgi:cell division protein FtsW
MLVYGLVMVFSASYPNSVLYKEQPFYYAARQTLWLVVGVVGMVVLARVPYGIWERWAVPLMGVTLVALVVLLLVGIERFGSTRTLLGGSVQPSQPAKVIIVVYIAAWLASKGDAIRNVSVGLIPFSALLGILSVLMVLQPSISTAVLVVITASIMFFIAGAAVGQLLFVGATAGLTFWLVIRYSGYASARIDRYIDSIWNPLASEEHQVRYSLQAMTQGGPFGVGIGQGTAQQPGFVPVPWSDNIYAVISEELGLLGALLVILLFALLAWRGLQIALRCRDPFGTLLAVGVTSMLVVQALFNMAVVVAAVPPTGVPLPFFSYGGSSMLAAMAAVGLLFSVSRYGRTGGRLHRPAPPGSEAAAQRLDTHARLDFGWRDGGTRLSGAGSGGAVGARSPGSPGTPARRPAAGTSTRRAR